MDTYRLNWREMTEFTKDGATGDKLSILSQKLTVGSGVIEGLDAFGCAFDTGVWTCSAYQPQYLGQAEQGYPRFGDKMNVRATLLAPAPTSIHFETMSATSLGYLGLAVAALGYLL